MRAIHFLEILYLANIVCHKTCMSLQYLICIRILQKRVLLYFHSFIPLACAECDDSLFSGASSIPFCYILFSATLLHQLFFHPPSLHLAIYFLVYLSILLFPISYIILCYILHILLLQYTCTVCLVKYFSNRGCAFEVHVVVRHKLTWIYVSRSMLLLDQTEYWRFFFFFFFFFFYYVFM